MKRGYLSAVALCCLHCSISLGYAQEPDIDPVRPEHIQPIIRAQPDYPLRLARRGMQGHVLLQFDIDEEGRPINITVVESVPSGAFDETSINAMRRFRYEPWVVDGEPRALSGVQYAFEFVLQR